MTDRIDITFEICTPVLVQAADVSIDGAEIGATMTWSFYSSITIIPAYYYLQLIIIKEPRVVSKKYQVLEKWL